ncbi:MAG: DUF1365 family protein [Deltaproteobacteria bacterium]|nr:DUF1365 family protein [Deltaproteobacteria bacterium]
MNSRLFSGYVRHTRLTPIRHRLQYSVYGYCFDLDELDYLDRTLPFFGYNRFRPASIYDADYLDESRGTIRDKLLRFLTQAGYSRDVSTIIMITSARYFNYVFNPVSLYYCFANNQDLACTVAEVNNTFGERHVYIPERIDEDVTGFPVRFRAPKQFHVSPFNDMAGTYEFVFADIHKELNIRINLYKDDDLAFYAELWGTFIPLTAWNHAKNLLKHPLLPHLTIPRIYGEATKLYFLKKLTYHPKPVPISMMTIRKIPPTLFQNRSLSFILSVMEKIHAGSLSVTLPDGTQRFFGDRQSPMRADLDIHDYRFFSRAILSGEIGLGESYMDDEWDSSDVSCVVRVLIENRNIFSDGNFLTVSLPLLRDRILHLTHANTPRGSGCNIRRHYDLSNDFFRAFLDRTMTYSCALFQSPDETLEQAQKNKLSAIIRKTEIAPDDHVLEIGCGWGSFAIETVKETGCRVTGITISREQYEYACQRVRKEGMEQNITILLEDYRTVSGSFDKIVTIEMLEAVGHKYFGTFFRCCDRLLKKGGLVGLQTISIADQRYKRYRKDTDWVRKHVFPGGHLPSLTALTHAITANSTLTIEYLENIGIHYSRTLREWRNRFLSNIEAVERLGFDRVFMRKWIYYLACCEACFASRSLGDLQIVLRKRK